MAPSKTPVIRLLHIIEEAEAISRALVGISSMSFEDSWVLQRAVEHGLLIISEATLPAELKVSAPDIAWRKIETLGNFLRHEYRDVDPELILEHHPRESARAGGGRPQVGSDARRA